MDSQDSLRLSILVALGFTGCAGASPNNSPSGESTSVVTIAPVSSATSVSDPVDSSEPGIPVISSKVGWVTESNGNVHRATVTTCDPTNELPACAGTESHLSCKTDADCKEHPHGKCVTGVGQVGTYCGCRYSCASDADCGADEACICKGLGRIGSGHSVCAQAACKIDADCESKQCSVSVYHNGCGTVPSLVCRTKADTCKSDHDCAAVGGQCAVLRPGPDAKWECARRSCVIGRPLVVQGETQSAPLKNRRDWQDVLDLDVGTLDPGLCMAAANHYAGMAAMEHASVASFARFSLQLMALGAPADLLQDAHRAALDEIEHARMAYGLASKLGTEEVGPDKLPAAVATIQVGIADFVKALVEEGCVGETLGAAEGRAAARSVAFPRMADMLSTIADDEERHAVLAWRTLQWAIHAFGDVARDAAEEAFVRAMKTYSKDPSVPMAAESLGILSGQGLGTLRRHVLSTVVRPCARSLGIESSWVGIA